MVRVLQQRFRRIRRRLRSIEGGGAIWAFWDRLCRRDVTRQLRIGGAEIWVRTNSSDVDVAISCLVDREFDHLRWSGRGVLIDAGANIGASTIFFAVKYPEARIIALEPEESNFQLLVENTARFKNVEPLRAALWGTPGKRLIRAQQGGRWAFTIADTRDVGTATDQETECWTVASLMASRGIDYVDVLKMDIEGSEKSVFDHSSEWVDRVGIITVELHEQMVSGCNNSFRECTRGFAAFEKHGEKVTAYRSAAP